MSPATVSYDTRNINISLSFEVLLENPDISKRLVDRMSEKKRAELNQHKRYIDKSKEEIRKAYEEIQNLELSYIARLDEERAKSDHHYRTVKAMIHILKQDVSAEKKVDSLWKLIEEMGY